MTLAITVASDLSTWPSAYKPPPGLPHVTARYFFNRAETCRCHSGSLPGTGERHPMSTGRRPILEDPGGPLDRVKIAQLPAGHLPGTARSPNVPGRGLVDVLNA